MCLTVVVIDAARATVYNMQCNCMQRNPCTLPDCNNNAHCSMCPFVAHASSSFCTTASLGKQGQGASTHRAGTRECSLGAASVIQVHRRLASYFDMRHSQTCTPTTCRTRPRICGKAAAGGEPAAMSGTLCSGPKMSRTLAQRLAARASLQSTRCFVELNYSKPGQDA